MQSWFDTTRRAFSVGREAGTASWMSKISELLERNLTTFFFVFSFLYIAVAIFSPLVGDYCPYLQHWKNVYLGLDPWILYQIVHELPGGRWINFCSHSFTQIGPHDYIVWANTYGPLHNVYGLTSIIFPTIPRVIGTVLYLIVVREILEKIRAQDSLSDTGRFWLYLGIFGNPFALALVAIIGGNDVYVAFFICAAIFALKRRNSALAGIAIGLGALIKFYPLYLVPFLAIDRRHLNIKFAMAAGLTFTIGMALAYLHWGALIFRPLTWNVDRGATPSSIIYLVTAALHAAFHVTISSSRVAFACLMPIALGALILQYKMRLTNLAGLIVGYLVVLTVNQIGYVQYYFPLMLALYLYFLFDDPKRANWALVLFFVSISLQAIIFVGTTNQAELHWIRIVGGVIVAVMNLYIAVAVLRQKPDAARASS